MWEEEHGGNIKEKKEWRRKSNRKVVKDRGEGEAGARARVFRMRLRSEV